jgi:cation:H+ antiporter
MFEQWIHQLPNALPGNLGLAALIAVSMFLLVKGADVLVEGAVELARDFGIPKLIIGATIVSLGTTTPEAAVSVLAAIQGNPGLAIGNGVGSLICDLALILGMAMILAKIPIRERMVNRQSRIVFAAAALFCVFAYLVPGQLIQRWMGFVLVGCLVYYIYNSLAWARRNAGSPDLAEAPGVGEIQDREIPKRAVWLSVLLMLGGLAVLILSSDVLIPCVELAAFRIGIPDAVIAATLVAFGTSLPELMTAISSIRKGHPELVLGNVLGADALNILFVIGVSASAAPLRIEPAFSHFQGPVMMGLLVLFQGFLLTTKGHFRRWQGVVLVAAYALFILGSALGIPRV